MKKRTLSLLLALLLCLSLLPAAALADEAAPPASGGWVMEEDTTVTPELRDLFDRAMVSIEGASYVPVAYEAHQVVAGMNYRFLAEKTVVYPEAETVEVRVTIYEDLEGNVEVTDIEELDPIDIDDPIDEPVDGGWVTAEDTSITPERLALFEKATAGLLGTHYEPVAYEAYQIVAGTNHRFLATVNPVVPDGDPAEARITIYEDLEGNAQVTDIEDLPPVTALPSVTISDDSTTAQAIDGFEGLYARVALVLDNGGISGLYVTQAVINPDGRIVIPAFQVPGLVVTGISVALVPTVGDIASPTPTVLASDFVTIK